MGCHGDMTSGLTPHYKHNKRIRAEKTLAQHSVISEERIGSIKFENKMRDVPIQTLTPSCQNYSKSENILAESRTGCSPLIPISGYTMSKLGKNQNPELGKNPILEIGKKSIPKTGKSSGSKIGKNPNFEIRRNPTIEISPKVEVPELDPQFRTNGILGKKSKSRFRKKFNSRNREKVNS